MSSVRKDWVYMPFKPGDVIYWCADSWTIRSGVVKSVIFLDEYIQIVVDERWWGVTIITTDYNFDGVFHTYEEADEARKNEVY